MLKRFAIELGTGVDLHGHDMTKAAVRAVQDAISDICLCGIMEILGRNRFQGVHVHADVAVPAPGAVDRTAVLAAIPIGETSLTLHQGGLEAAGIEVPCFGPGVSSIVMACAALTVSVDMAVRTDPAVRVDTDEAAARGAPTGTTCCGRAAGNDQQEG